MASEDKPPVVKENEVKVTDSSGDKEENKDEKVEIIRNIFSRKNSFYRKKMKMKVKKIKEKKNQIQVMDGLDQIIHGHKHSKKSM
jgi:hypothetical protein